CDATGVTLGLDGYYPAAALTGQPAWDFQSVQVTAPTSARTASFAVYMPLQSAFYVLVDDLAFRRVAGATLIEDGAIVTNKIAANAITSDKILAGTIQASDIATGTLTATQIAAGTISASLLAIGSGRNMIPNSDFTGGLKGLDNGFTNTGLTQTLAAGYSPWYPAGMLSAFQSVTGTPTNGTVSDLRLWRVNADGTLGQFSVKPSTKYELSAYFSTHRCDADMGIVWSDSAGAYISESHGNLAGFDFQASGGAISSWARSSVLVTSPATATSCYIIFRSSYNGTGVNPAIFVTGALLAEATPNQTVVSSWTMGGATVVDGGQVVTNSVNASKIIAGSITTDRFTANTIDGSVITAGSLAAAKIVADSITSGQIAVGAIQAAEIDAGAITTTKIGAGQITTSLLAVGTGRNLVPNSDGLAPYGTSTGAGFSPGGATFGMEGATWTAPGMQSFSISFATAPATGSYMLHNFFNANVSGLSYFPATPGVKYEASCYISNHRCLYTYIQLLFETSGGTSTGVISGNSVNTSGSGAISNWGRSVVIGVAPAGTERCYMRVLADLNGQTNPTMFALAPFLAVASPNQTEASPWAPSGVTVINGGQLVTSSVIAEKIVALTITADKIAANTLTAEKIAANTITVNKLVADTVTALRRGVSGAQTVAANSTVNLASKTIIVAIGPVTCTAFVNLANSDLLAFASTNAAVELVMAGSVVATAYPFPHDRFGGGKTYQGIYTLEGAVNCATGSQSFYIRVVNSLSQAFDVTSSSIQVSEMKNSSNPAS
ncbi:MAG: hypothetical protein H0W34_05840, partial [Pyrinomonadaceae bacterium]|nr:hypothetical protein [Pyrinomonadaceae bacterium]